MTNEWLVGQSVPDWFVTALCARIDVRTGRTEIAGAGHLGPFIKRADGAAEHVTLPPALALGMLPGEVYHAIPLELEPEDALVLVTDGITDRLATPADPLGDRALVRLLGCASRATSRTIEQLCDGLLGPKPARNVARAELGSPGGAHRGRAREPSQDSRPMVDATVVVLQIPGRRQRARAPRSATG